MQFKNWLTGLLMPILFLLLALLLQLVPGLTLSPARAQPMPPPAEGLPLGQPVPGASKHAVVNYHAPTVKLSDFRGKLLLLTFYGTWCSSSREPMPRLDSLQQAFDGQLQVLLVSYTGARDTKASVTAFLEQWRKPDGSRLGLPSIVDDTLLIKSFPHKRIPHFAWIGSDGTLQALTGPDQVTARNIQQAITTGVMPPSLLKDADLSQPLFPDNNRTVGNLLHYAILLKGKLDDGPPRMQLRREGEAIKGIVAANMSLLELYNAAKRNLYPAFGSKGLVLARVDSARLFQEKSGLSPSAWKAAHTYSYDLHLPPGHAGDFYRVMLDDLNRSSGYHASLELRETDCLLLVRKGRKDKLRSKGGEPESRLYSQQNPGMRNMPLDALVARLNGNNTLPQLVVNDTNYTGPVDIELKSGFGNLAALRKELQAYGLDLVKARRKTPLFVLRAHPVTANQVN